VQAFALKLSDNILQLHDDLANLTYRHGGYEAFGISDPKPRKIHKAHVRDRVLHHGIYRRLYPFFDKLFIDDSYSCRVDKGAHIALKRLESFGRVASRNNTRTVWVLKCDIRKFFANIDHAVLVRILAGYIPDTNTLWLLRQVIDSFHIQSEGKGLPLGNLTSQLFCNVYMNEFDQFVKHRLRIRHYLRYADDFLFLSCDKASLIKIIPEISRFLQNNLCLQLHPDKVVLKTFASGVDFLGWIHFPHHRVPRTATRRRMMKRIYHHAAPETLQSYLGMLKHGNANWLAEEIKNLSGLMEGRL
jgi:RNA-directed DNA polymerase